MSAVDTGSEPSPGVDPPEDTLRRLREAFSAGQTRPAEFRAAQLQGLGRFLQDNKQLLQDALAKDVGKVLRGDGRDI
nr:aldehyde dehydrogenase family 3 member B2-like [Meriones unguiculatus]